MGVAEALRRLAADQEVERLVGEHRHLGVEEGKVEILALTALVPVVEGGQHTDRCIEPGEHIGKGDAGLDRLGAGHAVGLSGNRHDAAHALDHEIVAGPPRIGSALAEACDRAIDQPGVDSTQALIIEPVFLQAADLEILHDDVGLPGEFA